MNRPYDSAEGIATYLADGLDGLNRLIKDRIAAGYDRHERLNNFVIMGHWATDTCGNFGRCEFQVDHRRVEIPKDFPKVATHDEAFRRVSNVSLSTFSSSDVPPSHVLCPECGKGWTIDNAHDTYVSKDDRVVPLTPGKTIAERQRDWDEDTEGVFRFGPEPSVRNAKFIDLSPHPEYKERALNEKGWRYHHPPFDHERLTKDYVAEEGDECSVTVFIFLHRRCWDLRKSRRQREYFQGVFERAAMTPATMNEIPNEYHQCEVCAPWYVAKFHFGDLKIGWRKHVINIDWSATKRDLEALFEGEDVTKGPHHVHAWGTDKAVDYLQRIKGAFT